MLPRLAAAALLWLGLSAMALGQVATGADSTGKAHFLLTDTGGRVYLATGNDAGLLQVQGGAQAAFAGVGIPDSGSLIMGNDKGIAIPLQVNDGGGLAVGSDSLGNATFLRTTPAGIIDETQFAPMSLQAPTTISIGAGSSTQWNPIPAGSSVHVTCTTATVVTYRSGVPSLTAVSTDNEINPDPTRSPNVLDVRLLTTETAMAFWSSAGNTCKGSIRNIQP